jgi:hypothetical protein
MSNKAWPQRYLKHLIMFVLWLGPRSLSLSRRLLFISPFSSITRKSWGDLLDMSVSLSESLSFSNNRPMKSFEIHNLFFVVTLTSHIRHTRKST